MLIQSRPGNCLSILKQHKLLTVKRLSHQQLFFLPLEAVPRVPVILQFDQVRLPIKTLQAHRHPLHYMHADTFAEYAADPCFPVLISLVCDSHEEFSHFDTSTFVCPLLETLFFKFLSASHFLVFILE